MDGKSEGKTKSVSLLHLARTGRLRALRYLHRDGLVMANLFLLPEDPETCRERPPRRADPSVIASAEKHAKVVQLIR